MTFPPDPEHGPQTDMQKPLAPTAGLVPATVQRALTGALLAVVVAWSIPAHADLFADNDARRAILQLRDTVTAQNDRLNALSRQVSELEKRVQAVQDGLAQSASQHDQSTETMDHLRGTSEDLAHQIALLQKNQHDYYSDLDQRLRKLEPLTVNVDGKTAQVDRNEEQNYEAAMSEFRNGDYRAAADAFRSFTARYPASAYGAAAQFWLGSSYFARKEYSEAFAAQRTLVSRFPDSPHVPEALLNMAASETAMGEVRGARITLHRVEHDFPGTDFAKLAQRRLATLPSEHQPPAHHSTTRKKHPAQS